MAESGLPAKLEDVVKPLQVFVVIQMIHPDVFSNVPYYVVHILGDKEPRRLITMEGFALEGVLTLGCAGTVLEGKRVRIQNKE